MNSFSPLLPWALGPESPRWTKTLRDKSRVVSGISSMSSIDTEENTAMSNLARFLGFDRTLEKDDPLVVRHAFWLQPAAG